MGGQLWSKPPWTRVMFRITADTVKQRLSSKGFRSHDLRAATRGSTPSAACRDTRTVTTTSPAALVIVAWELAVRLLAVPDYLLPPPSGVAAELVARFGC
jgi:hypothetical protein